MAVATLGYSSAASWKERMRTCHWAKGGILQGRMDGPYSSLLWTEHNTLNDKKVKSVEEEQPNNPPNEFVLSAPAWATVALSNLTSLGFIVECILIESEDLLGGWVGGNDTSRWVAGLSRAPCIYVSFKRLNGLTSFFEWIQIFRQVYLYHFNASCLNGDLSSHQHSQACCSFDIA